MRQVRLLPQTELGTQFRRELRAANLEGWPYAAHWVDSAERTALAIFKSWRKNYEKGERSRQCPTVTRLFARTKQSLCKLHGDSLRITVKARQYVWIDLSKRYFRLPSSVSASAIGEPTITPDMVHLPLFRAEASPQVPKATAWDFNLYSIDGFSPESGWTRIDTRSLASIHDNSSAKLGSIRRRFGNSVKARRLLRKYRHRELHRARKQQVEIARVLRKTSARIGIEALSKQRMWKQRYFNYRLSRTDWRGIAVLAGERVTQVSPRWTSRTCSRCGWRNKDLKGARVFECGNCGLRVDRQLNASVGIYQRMEGVPYDVNWWDRMVLPKLVGGYFQTGAESKGTDELVRSLYETVKPQITYGYDRHEDAYLSQPCLVETRVRAGVE
jgi:putative transposase